MIHSTTTMGLAIILACLAAVVARANVRGNRNEALALAKTDLVGHLIASGGLFTLLPEGAKIFAPELVGPDALAGAIWEHLDYVSFALISTAVGVNLMRRILQVRMLARAGEAQSNSAMIAPSSARPCADSGACGGSGAPTA